MTNGLGFQVPNAAVAAGQDNPLGLSLRWSAGPFTVGAAFDENVAGYETYGLYGSWNGGFINLYGQWEHGAINNAGGTLYEKIDAYSISAKIPMGAITWKVGYVGVTSDRANGDGYKIGGGLEYALSKRTSLYSTIGQAFGDRVDNATFANSAADDIRYDVGITHRF
ncbi:MAG TPA: porin [Burkholderiaceae bacterium]